MLLSTRALAAKSPCAVISCIHCSSTKALTPSSPSLLSAASTFPRTRAPQVLHAPLVLVRRPLMPLHLYFARARATGAPSTVPEDCPQAHSLALHHTVSTVALASPIYMYTLTHITAAIEYTVTFTLPNRSIRTVASPHGRTRLPRQGSRGGWETKTWEGKARGGAEKTREGQGEAREGKEEKARGLAVVQRAVTPHVSTHCS